MSLEWIAFTGVMMAAFAFVMGYCVGHGCGRDAERERCLQLIFDRIMDGSLVMSDGLGRGAVEAERRVSGLLVVDERSVS